MKTFIVHYAKLAERKRRIIPLLKSNRLDFEFVEHFDRNTINKKDCKIFKWERPFWFMLKPKHKATMAITLSHIYCWIEIAKKYECGLVLEDDAIFNEQFSGKLELYKKQLPLGWDMLFLGDGCNLHIPDSEIKSGINVYRKDLAPSLWGGDGGTRCVDSYIVSNPCAQKIAKYIAKLDYKVSQNVDWWLNQIMRDCNLNVYWAEPTIVTQGSQKKLYNTSWK